MIVKTESLTKYYGKKKAIEDVSLEIEEHAIYGFLGCNGAGKTTTISILSGLVKKTKGKITIEGMDFDTREDEIKQVIGTMPQNMSPYQHKTAYSNMLYYAFLKQMGKKEAEEEINSLFKEFNIEDLKDKKPSQMSHGQEKLILIMQAFLNKPKLVLLDEPISGFDPKRIVQLREFFRKKSKETTLLISSHDLDIVDKLCTHIGIIHDGKIILQGKKEKIKGKKTLEKIFIENI